LKKRSFTNVYATFAPPVGVCGDKTPTGFSHKLGASARSDRMGRPGVGRLKNVDVRLTEDEAFALRDRADAAGENISAYIRRRASFAR
jgi:hypothetical protein